MISPRTYREFFKPLDRRLAREVDLFWVHVHAGEVHLVDELLTMDEVRGVQIVHDGDASPPAGAGLAGDEAGAASAASA